MQLIFQSKHIPANVLSGTGKTNVCAPKKLKINAKKYTELTWISVLMLQVSSSALNTRIHGLMGKFERHMQNICEYYHEIVISILALNCYMRRYYCLTLLLPLFFLQNKMANAWQKFISAFSFDSLLTLCTCSTNGNCVEFYCKNKIIFALELI